MTDPNTMSPEEFETFVTEGSVRMWDALHGEKETISRSDAYLAAATVGYLLKGLETMCGFKEGYLIHVAKTSGEQANFDDLKQTLQ